MTKKPVSKAGRKPTPPSLVKEVTEVTRVTKSEQAEFRAASFLLNRTKADILRAAVLRAIEEAREVDPAKFKELLKMLGDH